MSNPRLVLDNWREIGGHLPLADVAALSMVSHGLRNALRKTVFTKSVDMFLHMITCKKTNFMLYRRIYDAPPSILVHVLQTMKGRPMHKAAMGIIDRGNTSMCQLVFDAVVADPTISTKHTRRILSYLGVKAPSIAFANIDVFTNAGVNVRSVASLGEYYDYDEDYMWLSNVPSLPKCTMPCCQHNQLCMLSPLPKLAPRPKKHRFPAPRKQRVQKQYRR